MSRPATKRRLIDRQRGDVETTNVAITLRRDEPSFFHLRHSMHPATGDSVLEDYRPDSAESDTKRLVSTERDGYFGLSRITTEPLTVSSTIFVDRSEHGISADFIVSGILVAFGLRPD